MGKIKKQVKRRTETSSNRQYSNIKIVSLKMN